MFNVHKSADAFFIFLFHFQHKLAAAPLGIACQSKSGINRVHLACRKNGGIFRLNYVPESFPVADMKDGLHSAKMRK